ncbi:MAG: hypothetical protein ACKODX_20450, partial [Gemmata sp.]
MNFSARTVLITLAASVMGLAVALAIVNTSAPATVVVPAPAVRVVDPAKDGQRVAVGMSGCLAAACHGAPAGKLLNGERGDD